MLDLTRPTILLDETVARHNIKKMAGKARENKVELIPHFKTHQSQLIGDWFREEGVDRITVSSVSMARYFAHAGWQHITIAFPLNILEIKEIEKLASSVELTLLVTGISQIRALIAQVDVFVNVLIEVDTGDHRSGLPAADHHAIQQLIEALHGSQHRFKGFYSHFGHTYQASSVAEVTSLYQRSLKLLTDLRFVFADVRPEVHVGDTPSASLITDFTGVTAIHAGNFVFYDLTQVQIGACQEEDIAVVLACPVVAKNADRGELIIYGGGIHLSKEGMFDTGLQATVYGKSVFITKNGRSAPIAGCYVRSVSQEHGVVRVTAAIFAQVKIGDIIGILPVHSCMMADTMAGYLTYAGKKIDHFNACRQPGR